MDKFLAEVKKVYEEKGNCMVAVSEGEEVPDVVLLEDFQDALVIRVVHIGVSDLVAAGEIFTNQEKLAILNRVKDAKNDIL